MLNRYRVPALAMTRRRAAQHLPDHVLRRPLEILAVSNIGYVFATCTALGGFLLLRKDRPNWPRPVRLPNYLGAARRRSC